MATSWQLLSRVLGHVPQGEGPPEQFLVVPEQIRFAPRMPPAAPNRIALTPPALDPTSLFETYTHPPSLRGKHAPPSGNRCHVYFVPFTSEPARASTRDVKPAGRRIPLASGAPSGPYGPSLEHVAANPSARRRGSSKRAPAATAPACKKLDRVIVCATVPLPGPDHPIDTLEESCVERCHGKNPPRQRPGLLRVRGWHGDAELSTQSRR